MPLLAPPAPAATATLAMGWHNPTAAEQKAVADQINALSDGQREMMNRREAAPGGPPRPLPRLQTAPWDPHVAQFAFSVDAGVQERRRRVWAPAGVPAGHDGAAIYQAYIRQEVS
ncbi:hypothetical protein H0H81_006744, partial [Sphagnurus paluster]